VHILFMPQVNAIDKWVVTRGGNELMKYSLYFPNEVLCGS